MLLMANRRETLRFIQDAGKMRRFFQKGKKTAECAFFDFRIVRASARALLDMDKHFLAQGGKQFVENILARIEIIVKRALGHANSCRNQRYRGIRVAHFADHVRGGLKQRMAKQFRFLQTAAVSPAFDFRPASIGLALGRISRAGHAVLVRCHEPQTFMKGYSLNARIRRQREIHRQCDGER